MCITGYSAEQTSKIMFQVCNNNYSKLSPSMPIQFRDVLVKMKNNCDTITNSFKPSKTGYFWFVFDIFSGAIENVNYLMRDITTGYTSGISSSSHTYSVLSESNLRYIQSPSQLQIFSKKKESRIQNK